MAPLTVRSLLIGWIALGLLLATAQGLSLACPAATRAMLAALQGAYGAGPPVPDWGRADRHIHLLASLLACLWFGLGCRLFAPRALPWLPVVLTVLLVLADELHQLDPAAGRDFEFGDLLAGGLGTALAIPLLVLLQRTQVAGPSARPRREPRA